MSVAERLPTDFAQQCPLVWLVIHPDDVVANTVLDAFIADPIGQTSSSRIYLRPLRCTWMRRQYDGAAQVQAGSRRRTVDIQVMVTEYAIEGKPDCVVQVRSAPAQNDETAFVMAASRNHLRAMQEMLPGQPVIDYDPAGDIDGLPEDRLRTLFVFHRDGELTDRALGLTLDCLRMLIAATTKKTG